MSTQTSLRLLGTVRRFFTIDFKAVRFYCKTFIGDKNEPMDWYFHVNKAIKTHIENICKQKVKVPVIVQALAVACTDKTKKKEN